MINDLFLNGSIAEKADFHVHTNADKELTMCNSNAIWRMVILQKILFLKILSQLLKKLISVSVLLQITINSN